MLVLLVLFSTVFCASAQTFPKLETYDLSSNEITIPNDLNDKPTIVFMAFTKKAESVLSKWYNPVYTLFLDQSGFNAMAYDCHVKMVMMFTGATATAADKIVDNVKRNIDPSFSDYLLFYEGSFNDEMKALGIKKKDDAYVFVIDKTGKILLQEKGNYTEAKLERIADLMAL